MLEKPNIPDDQIAACLRDVYGLPVAQVAFLPLNQKDMLSLAKKLLDGCVSCHQTFRKP